MRIWDDPTLYSQLLEENKRNLKSALAYEKNRKAVDAILSGHRDTEVKINTVIRYLLNRCEDITPMALQKALYYIQGFYYAFYQVFFFPENCKAWVHEPVYRDIYITLIQLKSQLTSKHTQEICSSRSDPCPPIK